ncbi:hypothetical protein NVP1262O_40 [Vibrio phage 1.262.O._10N.286.51.A9]|nr:hypothetical protein NVP1262O_40 [Vibrio phage 1.262.O._10N.286.51.A9]
MIKEQTMCCGTTCDKQKVADEINLLIQTVDGLLDIIFTYNDTTLFGTSTREQISEAEDLYERLTRR